MNEYIKARAGHHGMNLGQFARRIGWTYIKLYRFTKNPDNASIKELKEVAKGLNIGLVELVKVMNNG